MSQFEAPAPAHAAAVRRNHAAPCDTKPNQAKIGSVPLPGAQAVGDFLIDRCGAWWLDFRPRLGLGGGTGPNGTLGAQTPREHSGMLAAVSTADFVDTLIYGENLEVLQRFIADESVDLIYLDPPFNKNKAYSLIFKDESGQTSDAQLATFEDYWHWGPTPERHYAYLTNGALHAGRVPHSVSALVGALHSSIRPSPMLAYLVEMATRVVELHRVLRRTGTLYLHCDPTASHYLKLLLDAVFGPERFLGEIVWKRTTTHSDAKRWSPDADRLLVYAKSDAFTFHPAFAAHDPGYVERDYRFREPDGRVYRLHDIGSPNPRPNLMYEWKGHRPPAKGWRFSRETMERLDREGRIWYPDSKDKRPKVKRYLADMPGMRIGSVWTDLPNVHPWSKERLGYPTQKPLALLERIVTASSNEGDVVLDPFCGCGTAIEAAIATGRHWIGIDNSNLAVQVITSRMQTLRVDLSVFDWPTETDGVARMVEAPGGRHRFEAWGLTRLNAQPVRELGGRGADQGIDGRIAFTLPNGRVETIIVSIKSGHVGSPALRDLKGTVERERAAMGLLFTLQESTEPMRKEAVTAGFYRMPGGATYPRIVILTVRDLLEGRMPDLPSRHGVQVGIWQQLPTASRAVHLRPARKPTAGARVADQPVHTAVSEIREAYAESASPEGPRSRRTSKRDLTAPLPLRESSDTD